MTTTGPGRLFCSSARAFSIRSAKMRGTALLGVALRVGALPSPRRVSFEHGVKRLPR